ncbi:MAG: NAD-dependent epimerase/dehydratase family protein, partial [Deltaproteobacteria bacterium]|nr:NAD-dependent epimerase/dehydratase family protein [Deltaproteobacteria bacterium]
MKTCVVTGAAGLIGSEAVRTFAGLGYLVVGIDNDLRRHFFGEEGSTRLNLAELAQEVPTFRNQALDIRDYPALDALFAEHGGDVELVIHTAAQPSHDWAARDPFTDFGVNAQGTLNVLEAVRESGRPCIVVAVTTDKCYENREKVSGYRETEPLGGSDPYSAS